MIGGEEPIHYCRYILQTAGGGHRPACWEELGVSSADEVLQPLGRATCWDNSFLGVEVELRPSKHYIETKTEAGNVSKRRFWWMFLYLYINLKLRADPKWPLLKAIRLNTDGLTKSIYRLKQRVQPQIFQYHLYHSDKHLSESSSSSSSSPPSSSSSYRNHIDCYHHHHH